MEHPHLHASTNNQLKELLLQYDIIDEDIEGTGVNGRVTKIDRIRTITELYKHTKDDFVNWSIQISKGSIVILNHNGKKVASKRVNTSSLKSTFQYTIYVTNSKAFIWIEFGYNAPVFTPIDDFVDDSIMFLETPDPHITYGRPIPGHSGRKIDPHRCYFG